MRVRVPVAVRELRFNLSDSGQVKIQLECDCQRAKHDSAKSTSPTQCKWHQSETNYTCMCVRNVSVCECVCSTKGDYVCHVKWSVGQKNELKRVDGGETARLGTYWRCVSCVLKFSYSFGKNCGTLTHTLTHTFIQSYNHTCNIHNMQHPPSRPT